MGFKLGCHVGYGPRFGPEVVGYFGASCSIRFNVGTCLAFFVIGLPDNIIFAAPNNSLLGTFGLSSLYTNRKGIFLDMKNNILFLTTSY